MMLMGEKIGMTQIFDADGSMVPVTVVRIQPNIVTLLKTAAKAGYNAVQIGYGATKENRLKAPTRKYLKKNNLPMVKTFREIAVTDIQPFQLGKSLKVEIFKSGDVLDVQAVSKGRGFQGVMKRWHFAGGADSHGCSVSHRVPGSIGQRAYPGRVFPGKKMPGQMGSRTTTVKNLKVVGVEKDQNLLLIRGALPGANGQVVCLFPKANDFEKRCVEALAS